MGLVTRWFGNGHQERHAGSDYIDLSDYAEHAPDADASTMVRVAEVRKYDDFKEFSTAVYAGDVLVLDFKKVAGDEILLKRMTNDLRRLAADVGGDLAGVGENLIMVTPGGIRVDRQKLRTQNA